MISLTNRRRKIFNNWVNNNDIIDSWVEKQKNSFIAYGYGRNRKFYKKIIR